MEPVITGANTRTHVGGRRGPATAVGDSVQENLQRLPAASGERHPADPG